MLILEKLIIIMNYIGEESIFGKDKFKYFKKFILEGGGISRRI